MPIVVFAENCTDGTNEWLEKYKKDLNLEVYIEQNEVQRGIGGGIDFCVSKVKTEFVNILHSDFWIAPNQDIELLKLYDGLGEEERLIASSFRVQPNIFPNDPPYRPGTVFYPVNDFGAYHHDFKQDIFDEWSKEFSDENKIKICIFFYAIIERKLVEQFLVICCSFFYVKKFFIINFYI